MSRRAREEIIQDLVEDLRQVLDDLEAGLLSISSRLTGNLDVPREILDAAFRAFHTVKGTAGFFDLTAIVRVAHDAEALLEALRAGRIPITEPINQTLIRACDFLRVLLERVANTRSDAGLEDETETIRSALETLLTAGETVDSTPLPVEEEAPTPAPAANFGFFSTASEPEQAVADAPPATDQGSLFETPRDRTSGRDVRISTGKLDSLMDLVGELVITESMVHREAGLETLNRAALTATTGQLKKIVRNIQETALSLRMVSLSGVYSRLRRQVHDLQRKSGKKINLRLEGEETEIDKNLIEAVADPLIHLIRNAVDHGLESPAERVAAGKPETGRLLVDARHNGSEVVITLTDDGRGLDRNRILQRAGQLGLLDRENGAYADSEVFNFIFLPGFSTAAEVTDISGRGVGLDVVRKNLDGLNGRVSVDSLPDGGTAFTLHLPLTTAILEGMVLRIGEIYLVVPTTEIDRSLDARATRVHDMQEGVHLIKSEERLVPVVKLDQIMQIKHSPDGPDFPLMVLFNHRGARTGLYVDEIVGNQDVVIKALPDFLRNLRSVTGCTILGNGSVSLILDVGYLTSRFRQGIVGGL